MSNQQHSKAGRIMFLLVWIILFVGLVLFFYSYEQSDSKVTLSTATEYVLRADKSGHYQIKGRINNQEVIFLVDTGATLVGIPKNIADKLHIRGRYPITISTANGEVTGALTRLEQLSFGHFVLYDVKAVIMPSSDDKVLLGMNILSQFNIGQDEQHLILKKRRKSP